MTQGMVLLWGPRREVLLMSEVPLHGELESIIKVLQVHRREALVHAPPHSEATEAPSWGYPVFVLGAICSFLWGNIVKS
jgi:hypothetical protein